jgi:hypothetical protein
MAFNPMLMKQSLEGKPPDTELRPSGWRIWRQRIRQEPLAVVLLVWAVLFLLTWLLFAWLG